MTDDRSRGDGAGERELDAAEQRALAAWQVGEPPAGFAERVLAARQAPAAAVAPPARAAHRRWRSYAVIAAVGVVAVTWFALRAPRAPSAHGALAAGRRETVRLGGRGVAVAEPGAALTWAVDGGAAVVSQAAGEVFYRVEPGGRFAVETPAGQVVVTGTCFRVEVEAMKTPVQGLVGAVVGAAIVVTVYEGSVRFTDRAGGEQRASAGERLVIGDGPGAGAAKPAEALAGPPPDISRDDLLVRERVQRDEIAVLRERVRALEGQASAADGPDGRTADGRPWFDPSPAELERYARDCRVRLDLPPVMESSPRPVGPHAARELGLAAEEIPPFEQAHAAVHARFTAGLRAIYLEVTGNQAGADELSPQAMGSEIRDKSPEGEEGRVRRLVARERAGQLAPPSDLAHASPYERYFRLLAGLGDDLERELATRVGAARARAMRGHDGGWPMRMDMAGCDG